MSPERTDFKPEMADFGAEKADFRTGRAEIRSDRNDFWLREGTDRQEDLRIYTEMCLPNSVNRKSP